MILKKLIIGPLGTNCYIFGNDKEVVIIDPGAESDTIIREIEALNATPLYILLTHGHFDHTMQVGKIKRYFEIPLLYNQKEFDNGIFIKKADRWLKQGDLITVGKNVKLQVLETPGHSPGSICLYSKDVKELNNNKIDGIVFTGDLIFRRSVGRTDIPGGNSDQLFESIKNKIMYNPDLSDNFLILPGHMGDTSIGEEREFNYFKDFFL
ncbi:MAG TPA: MBL fold metallo-hydrolase [Candidatus Lokiarchaeia archaeon]